MRTRELLLIVCALSLHGVARAADPAAYSWRYYRPGNTGIQGDYNEAIWLSPDGDPWIAGYNPVAEEGGIAKFIQAENRWINVSNIDYPVFGSANVVGTSRVSEMISDGQGNLWLGAWRGVLRMNLAAGPASLKMFDPSNSALPGGLTRDMSLAPDGSIWVSSEAVSWGGGGLTRYDPATAQWTHMNGHGGSRIAAQPKPGGGYYIWCDLDGYDGMERWDSTTQTWTTFFFGAGQPASLPSQDVVDDAGNVWMTRWIGPQGDEILDCLRPDGTWVNPPLPPRHPQVPYASVRAFGNMQALLVTGYAHLYRFNGTSWTDLGPEPYSGWIQMDIDAAGNIWLSGVGTGGVFRRDAVTGFWQRYRVTNTSQFDFFNNDLAIDPHTGDMYACANANPDIGGMVKFDGTRWTGFVNQDGYGLTGPWPWPGAPQSEAVYVRPSNGHIVANPINQFTHEFDGTSWTDIPGGPDQMRQYVEDSLGRLWGVGHYGGLGIFENGGYTLVSGFGGSLRLDPDRPGTVWFSGIELVRTDGVGSGSYRFSRTIDDFPEAAGVGASFAGLAVDHDGVAWVGTVTSTGTGSTLVRLDANTGAYQIWQHDLGWPFPSDHVYPLTVTPDGRVWMTYDNEYPSTDAGLLWWDGAQVGVFPAPPNGGWTWGGLPHATILDLEVKTIPGGYELWMSCMSRGIAVLTVAFPVAVYPEPPSATLALEQNRPNPFRSSTQLGFSIPQAERVQLAIYDVGGRLVRMLVDREMSAGRHEVAWDGRDADNRTVSSGVYFYKLDRSGQELRRKMVVLW